MTALLQAALDYAAQGRRVHPCDSTTKRPLTAWSRTATTVQADIEKLWTRWPEAAIGLCTGDGLAVVDVDPRHGGEFDSTLAETLTATTPGGGWHHYMHAASAVGSPIGILPGVDVRSDGAYVLACPTPGYEFVNPNAPILPLPDVILGAIERHTAAKRTRGFELRAHVPAGERHSYLLSFAGWLVANELAETYEDVVAETLDHASQVCAPPDSERSRRSHVEGIARWVLARDRGAR